MAEEVIITLQVASAIIDLVSWAGKYFKSHATPWAWCKCGHVLFKIDKGKSNYLLLVDGAGAKVAETAWNKGYSQTKDEMLHHHCCSYRGFPAGEDFTGTLAPQLAGKAFSLVRKGRDGGMLCGYEHYKSDRRNVASTYPFVHDEGPYTLNSKFTFLHLHDDVFQIALHNPQKPTKGGTDMHHWLLSAYKNYDNEIRNCASTYVCVHAPCDHGRNTWYVRGSCNDLTITLADDTNEAPCRMGWELSSVRHYEGKDIRNCASEWAIIHEVNRHSSGNRWKVMHSVNL